MKKLMTTMLLLMITVIMSAQVKISPKYKKGDNMLYRSTIVTTTAGKNINFVTDIRYKVLEASSKGYTIEVTSEKAESDAASNDLTGRLLNLTAEMMTNIKGVYTTDADGKVTGIKNYEEMKEKTLENIDKLMDGLFKELPEEASQILSKDMVKNSMTEKLTQEYLIELTGNSPSPLTLNGKVLSTGYTDASTTENGMKVTNTYTLLTPDASKVKVTGQLNMTKEDMKKMIIEQVKSIMPDQVEMIEQNIESVMESGMMKMERTQTTDYEFFPNGWVKNISYTYDINTAGSASVVNGKIELVESNRK